MRYSAVINAVINGKRTSHCSPGVFASSLIAIARPSARAIFVDADTTRNLRLTLQIDESVKEQIRRD